MLEELRLSTPQHILDVVEHVWRQQDAFVRWPARGLLFIPDAIRAPYHKYTPKQKQQIRAVGAKPDGRSNGPAVMAFLIAGGERPFREHQHKQWSIHHIYDGKFPALGARTSTHAVKDGRYFTEAAGLIAAHPIADALADEVPYFAWLLRHEAFKRFGFDPDEVFS